MGRPKKKSRVSDNGYEHLGNKGTHDARSPVVEAIAHLSSPTLYGIMDIE